MSILIKGMEMPESCSDCFLDYDSIVCMALNKEFPDRSSDDGYYAYCSSRMPDCPLVPVPPHGRLIDADVLMNDGWTLHKQVMRMGGYAIHEMPLDNPNVSIVIPADKDGET